MIVRALREGKTPDVLPDDQYPDWLWTIDVPGKSLSELRSSRYEDLTEKEVQRMVKLGRKRYIMDENMSKKKK